MKVKYQVKKIFKKNLQNKFLLLFIFVSLIPIVGVTIYSFKISYDIAKNNMAQSSVTELKNIDSIVYEKKKDIERFIVMITANENIRQILKEDNRQYVEFNAYVKKCAKGIDNISGAVFITASGNIYTYNFNSVNIDKLRLQISYNNINEAPGVITWFGSNGADDTIALNNNTFIAGTIYHDDENTNAYNQLAKVYIYVNKSIFGDAVKDAAEDTIISILDESGTRIISSNTDVYNDISNNSMSIQENIYAKYEGILETSANSKKVSVVHYNSLYTDFKYVKIYGIETYNKGITNIIFISLFIIIMLIIILVVIYSAISKRITAPISELAITMKSFNDETLNNPFKIKGTDEIADIAEGFNKMLSRISVMIDKIKEEEEEKKNAQIKSLSNEINSHFLYNTLTAIRITAMMHKDFEVSDSLLMLNKILKFVLSNTNKFISLTEEFEYVQNYVKLMQLRYKNIVQFSYELPPVASEFLIPAMILQPIVENSFVHGLMHKIKTDNFTARILADVKVYQNYYIVEIFDNGVGMTEEEISMTLSCEKETRGVGISNVKHRLSLLYGGDCEITINSEKDMYTSVFLKIPINSKE